MKTSPKRKNAQLSKSAKTEKSKQCLDNLGPNGAGDVKSTRVDVEFKCSCDICEDLIATFHLQHGNTVYVFDSIEHAFSMAEFIGGPLVMWIRFMTRRQYQMIPQPADPSLN